VKRSFSHPPHPQMDSWIGESLALACGGGWLVVEGGVMELVDDKWMKNMDWRISSFGLWWREESWN